MKTRVSLKYFVSYCRFNGGYLRDWVSLYIQNNDVAYFDSFGAEHIPKEIRTFIGNKNIKANVFRIQAFDSITCGCCCTGFIDSMLAGTTLTEFTNLFSTNNF